jgi:hypothetical protein
LLTNYDQQGKNWLLGDFNGDGKVNIADLGILLTNYDRSQGMPDLEQLFLQYGIGVTTPEPSSAILLLGGGLALVVAGRMRRQYR